MNSIAKLVHGMVGALLGLASFFGMAAGLAVLYVTWQHNPQCEFHCDGVVHWGTWLPYGAVATVLGFVAALPVAFAVTAAVAIVRQRKRDSDASAT
jgi:hypothetical protein